MNPVLFEQFESHKNLIMLSEDLSEFRWKNQIVGFSDEGLLIAKTRTPHKGFYTFTPVCIRWANVEQLKVSTKIAILGMLLGVVAILIGVAAFWAGWVAQTHTGPGVFTIPVLGPLGGLVLIFGGRRNVMSASTSDGTKVKWTSGPLLSMKESIPKCESAVSIARQHRIELSGRYTNPARNA